MSADTQKRGVLHKGTETNVVIPQPVSDKSIIDSVAGIINDIVPQAYSSIPISSCCLDNKDTITWARFEQADINDPELYPDFNEGTSSPPLLLVLGYNTGVQVWLVAASGEATEVLFWRQGVVRTLKILPNVKGTNDPFQLKRPLVAICDSNGPGTQFCGVGFLSLKTGEQIKSIKFKNTVCDILANKRSIIVTFQERIAVFDARTLEDVLSITTCYPSPGPNPNPVALGTRWLAYCEKKLVQSTRSSGGRNADGVQSYTATVLYAAKSLGKGLRGLGETVASSLTGQSVSPVAVNNVSLVDAIQAGVVTILDLQDAQEGKNKDDAGAENIIAHFTAHSEAIVAMTFDTTGALLMTADKRGHDFNVFRIHPHPSGSSLAAVHHLYTLHRGDTTAKVQDMTFSSDARWAAVSTVRGTTHVFPIAPYGGPVGVRTHSSAHVVNRLSRFQRSAGLSDDAMRSQSPISQPEYIAMPYNNTNPRLPPYPTPNTVTPLAQIRQPTILSNVPNQLQSRVPQRQRTQPDDNITLPVKLCACFAPPRAWMYAQRETANKIIKRPVDSLFIMACHGNMIQYDFDVKPVSGLPKEKVCDDTPIELEVEAKGQWLLVRTPGSTDINLPLTSSNLLITFPVFGSNSSEQTIENNNRWLSQVEIFTHAGPHRRLWMGPQFSFKTYNTSGGNSFNMFEEEVVEVGGSSGSRLARSNPVNMPNPSNRSFPLVIDGSGSSLEQSPCYVDAYADAFDHDSIGIIGCGESQLKQDLAEAMLETSSISHKITGRPLIIERVGQPVTKVINPLGNEITVSAIEDQNKPLTPLELEIQVDTLAELPRSICAEEGPASLGDLDRTEGQDLKEHTKICAEICNPPIFFDSDLNESIQDLEENNTFELSDIVDKDKDKAANANSDKKWSKLNSVRKKKNKNHTDKRIKQKESSSKKEGEMIRQDQGAQKDDQLVKSLDNQMVLNKDDTPEARVPEISNDNNNKNNSNNDENNLEPSFVMSEEENSKKKKTMIEIINIESNEDEKNIVTMSGLDMVEIIHLESSVEQQIEYHVAVQQSNNNIQRNKSKRYRKSQNGDFPEDHPKGMPMMMIMDDLTPALEMPSQSGSWNTITKRRNSLKRSDSETKLEPLLEIGDADDNKENYNIVSEHMSVCKKDILPLPMLQEKVENIENSGTFEDENATPFESILSSREDVVLDEVLDKTSEVPQNVLNMEDPKVQIEPMDTGGDGSSRERSIEKSGEDAIEVINNIGSTKKTNRWKKKKRR